MEFNVIEKNSIIKQIESTSKLSPYVQLDSFVDKSLITLSRSRSTSYISPTKIKNDDSDIKTLNKSCNLNDITSINDESKISTFQVYLIF